ncbi:MAG: SAM-dependent methyltransferase [Treponema sp.]|nr:SAM-dependent methyltransferase [Treponema sp.]
MLLSATLSKPSTEVEKKLGRNYQKIKIRAENSAEGFSYFVEMFTKTQVFHQHFSEKEALEFIENNVGTSFKNCSERTDSEEITILTNKKGKITRLVKKISTSDNNSSSSKKNDSKDTYKNNLQDFPESHNILIDEDLSKNPKNSIPGLNLVQGSAKKKNYILQEGKPVPFLVLLGIMTAEGKVISSKYDKFRQINRFLEFIDDTVNALETCRNNESSSENQKCKDKQKEESSKNPQKLEQALRILDFGCGKSYLTFAVHYYLTEIRKIPCQIEGLDLKEDVINYCNQIRQKLGLEGLVFRTGNIADYSQSESPDIVITLHACDTATDFALEYAVSHNARAILSVPCCQHQINTQITENKELLSQKDGVFSPLLKHGLLRERFSALLTDALRGEWLEQQGYKVQMLEFIEMENTPKNILIRAIKKDSRIKCENDSAMSIEDTAPKIIEELKIKPELWKN